MCETRFRHWLANFSLKSALLNGAKLYPKDLTEVGRRDTEMFHGAVVTDGNIAGAVDIEVRLDRIGSFRIEVRDLKGEADVVANRSHRHSGYPSFRDHVCRSVGSADVRKSYQQYTVDDAPRTGAAPPFGILG